MIKREAWRQLSSSSLLPKHCTDFLRLTSENMDKISVANVVVLIPPAVEPEEPPMNIKRIVMAMVLPRSDVSGSVLNPAVRGLTARNSEVSTRSPPQGTLFSEHKIIRKGTTMRIAVVVKTNFVCREYFLKCSLFWHRSRQTKKPMPPTIMSAETVKVTMG